MHTFRQCWWFLSLVSIVGLGLLLLSCKDDEKPAGPGDGGEQPPTADFTATPISGGVPLAVQFTDRSTGTISIREWIFGDGGTSAIQNPLHVYQIAGTYSVSLMVWGPQGRDTTTRSNYIFVEAGPTANFTASPTSGAAPLTVQFTDQSTGTVTSRQWTFGDGGTSTERDPSYVYANPGTYSVTLVVSGPVGIDTTSKANYILVATPVPGDLFPLIVGHRLTYVGYATRPGSGSQIPDPTGSYRTTWTITSNVAPSPLGGVATSIVDSTTGPFGPGGLVVTIARTLFIRKDTTEDFEFLQTIGPFKRAFGIPIGTGAADTLVWIAVARPSYGVGTPGLKWTAFDSIFTGSGGAQVRLQIFGKIETQETITDSTTAHTQHNAYRSRTWRRIMVNGTIVQDDATIIRLYLAANIGPVQMHIVEDTENIGHFRVLSGKNF
ncbi:MAG TPA: PKD domain-containing protein [Bacteroidota bacterium]|nr:PKD domain-containing protein [Bacteroidota bacterium]